MPWVISSPNGQDIILITIMMMMIMIKTILHIISWIILSLYTYMGRYNASDRILLIFISISRAVSAQNAFGLNSATLIEVITEKLK